jgi:hypothetical protein
MGTSMGKGFIIFLIRGILKGCGSMGIRKGSIKEHWLITRSLSLCIKMINLWREIVYLTDNLIVISVCIFMLLFISLEGNFD